MTKPKSVELYSQWEESSRPGHVVIVSEISISKYTSEIMVTYGHFGIHNKRAQRHKTISPVANFLRRYKRIR